MESTHHSNTTISLKGDLDTVTKEYNQAVRESMSGDNTAASRAVDLQAQISSIKEGIKNADTEFSIAEAKEEAEKQKKEVQEIAQNNALKKSKETNEDLRFLDDYSPKKQALVASAQTLNPATAQVAGIAQVKTSNDKEDTAKPVSSSGQAST